jgi:leucyl aminopeptidase (aminopeptidase T)
VEKDLLETARTVVTTCLDVRPGEHVMVITDSKTEDIGQSLWLSVQEITDKAVLCHIMPGRIHGEEPPAHIGAALEASGVAIMATSKSLSHTEARKRACSKGARIVSLPGILKDSFLRISGVDYPAMAEFTARVGSILDAGHTARIIGERGEVLSMGIGGRRSVLDTGIYHRPGDFGNLPAGEAYLAPVEGSANGIITVDGSIAGVGLLETPVQLEVRDGMVKSIQGGEAAARLEELLGPVGQLGKNLAELGVGTNSAAMLTGLALEDEKVAGTIHVALGANATFGGRIQVPIHLDLVVRRPTLLIDEKPLLDRGRLME